MHEKMILFNSIAGNTFVMAPRRPLEVWGEFPGDLGYHTHLEAEHCVPDT